MSEGWVSTARKGGGEVVVSIRKVRFCVYS